jgi:hypothetical protein
MNIATFEQAYGVMSMRELRVRNPMRIPELLEAIRGEWTMKSYRWLGRNCQHFTDHVREILGLELMDDADDDDGDLPSALRFRRLK